MSGLSVDQVVETPGVLDRLSDANIHGTLTADALDRFDLNAIFTADALDRFDRNATSTSEALDRLDRPGGTLRSSLRYGACGLRAGSTSVSPFESTRTAPPHHVPPQPTPSPSLALGFGRPSRAEI